MVKYAKFSNGIKVVYSSGKLSKVSNNQLKNDSVKLFKPIKISYGLDEDLLPEEKITKAIKILFVYDIKEFIKTRKIDGSAYFDSSHARNILDFFTLFMSMRGDVNIVNSRNDNGYSKYILKFSVKNTVICDVITEVKMIDNIDSENSLFTITCTVRE